MYMGGGGGIRDGRDRVNSGVWGKLGKRLATMG